MPAARKASMQNSNSKTAFTPTQNPLNALATPTYAYHKAKQPAVPSQVLNQIRRAQNQTFSSKFVATQQQLPLGPYRKQLNFVVADARTTQRTAAKAQSRLGKQETANQQILRSVTFDIRDGRPTKE